MQHREFHHLGLLTQGRRMKTIEGALKSHLLQEGYVSASHMECCHDPLCQRRPLNPGRGCVQWIPGHDRGKTNSHNTQKPWTALKPIRQGKETTQPRWGERQDGYAEWTQNFSKEGWWQLCNKGNNWCGGLGWGEREKQDLNDWW